MGCIKGAIKIYEVQPEGEPDFADGVFPDSDLPSNKPEEVIVRVYVVKVRMFINQREISLCRDDVDGCARHL